MTQSQDSSARVGLALVRSFAAVLAVGIAIPAAVALGCALYVVGAVVFG